MNTVSELKKLIESYRTLLAEVDKPYRASKDEAVERMLSGMLLDARQKLKVMERRTVKLHGVVQGEGGERPVGRLPVIAVRSPLRR